jgi:hypothetical protein
MVPENALLQTVKEKFPKQAERIEMLYRANEDFRSLCFDYDLCLKYLQKFKTESDEKKLSIKEYSEVQTELEDELSQFISND